MKLIRDGLIEYKGTKKEIVDYLLCSYEDDYWIQEYRNSLYKDNARLNYVIECLGMKLTK